MAFVDRDQREEDAARRVEYDVWKERRAYGVSQHARPQERQGIGRHARKMLIEMSNVEKPKKKPMALTKRQHKLRIIAALAE